ncbi:MAG: hypothetical protein HFE86_01595, partial [Clostridiales bacterium]|nr:hypothetical protein [Clostridiales bacterium]
VTAAEELGEGKILVGVGERKAAAGDYTVDAVVPEEGFVRFTMPGGGFIKLPNLGADGACSLTLEARCVSGSPGQIGPNVEPYYWDGASGYLDLPANGEWKPAALSNIDNGSLFNLGITCYKAGTYDIRNISLTDAAGSDIIDHAAFRAQGEYHPVVEDTPENHQLPTLQKVRELTGPIDTRLTAAKTELDQTRSLLADMVTICGVRFEGGDNSGPTVTRLYDAAGKTAGAGTDTQTAHNDFDHIYPWSARRRCCGSFDESGRFTVNAYAGDPGFTTDGSGGEVWVEHSLFYYKHVYDGGAEEILISSCPLTGFSPAPIFLKPDGSLLQKAYTAAYPMATVDGKATSRAGVFSDAYSLNTAMTAARSLGEHYAVSTTAEWYTECLYMWVEFATRNLQSVMAGATSLPFAAADTAALAETDTNRVIVTNAVANTFVIGQTIGIGTAPGGTQVASNRIVTAIETYDADHKALIFDGPAVDIAAGNTVWSAAWVNGSCDGVLSSSGSPVSNTGGKYNCVYRGKESPYGNAFEWISDLLFKREGAGTADDPHSYAAYYLPDPDKYAAGQITTDYVKLNFKLPDADGYVKKLGLDARYPHTRIPTETGAAASAYYSDYYYKPAAPVCAASVGGSWNGGALAGPCYWNCNASPSDASPHRRARLSFHRS